MNGITKKRMKYLKPIWIIIFIIFSLWALSIFYCFYQAIITSFKDPVEDYFQNRTGLPKVWKFSNYADAFFKLNVNNHNVVEMIFNSLWMTFGTMIPSILTTAVTAYCVAKYDKVPGMDFLHSLALIIMIIPLIGSLPALLKLYRALNFVNSPLILCASFSGLGMAFVVYYGFFKSVSWTYAEAAFMDGAGHFQVFFKVMFPQAISLTTAFGLTSFIGGWNDFSTSLVFMDQYPTLAYGLYTYQIETSRAVNTPMLFAGLIVSLVPLLTLYFIFQNTLLELNMGGGIKG